jgi:hypothetical protein
VPPSTPPRDTDPQASQPATPARGSADSGQSPREHPGPSAGDVERWLVALGLAASDRAEREGVSSWDLTLDGERRRDLRVTVILDPSLGAIAWAHLAPPILDAFRKTYRTLLQWNDEFPFAKFSLADDGRPILEVEIPGRWLDEEELGLALARVIAVADRIFEATREWLWIGGRVPDGYAERPQRTEGLRSRFAARLGELVAPEASL